MPADGHAYDFAAAPSPEELARFERNDFGNALRLIRLVGGTVEDDLAVRLDAAELLYLREIGWIGWNGRHWDLKLGQRLAERTAHRVATGLMAQAAIWVEEKILTPAKAYDFARASGNAGACAAMLRVAEGYLQVDLDDFDQDPMALSVRNGTLKFERTGEGVIPHFTAHDPRDRITRMAAVTYDRTAAAPLWRASLGQWQPDAGMVGYLQRLAGYVMTGHTYEQLFVILQGKGNDGKSTFMGVLRELLGDYAGVADVKTFLDIGQRGGGDASPDLARLAGDTRLVSVAEPPRGARLNEAMIKSFTGGAPITARRLRQDIFEFLPKPKVIMEANSRPKMAGDDDGIWRRIRLIMFEHPVPKADVDKTFITRLRPEFPGILNWMIEGLADWLDSGMREPDQVRAAMDDYRKGSSPFGEWFVERVEPADGVKTLASAFYADWKDWAEAQGIEKPMTQRAFGDAMADRQIIRAGKDASGKAWRIGARLRPKWAPAGGDVGAASAGFEADPGFAPRDDAE
jgi:putative DNA primase/helicase